MTFESAQIVRTPLTGDVARFVSEYPMNMRNHRLLVWCIAVAMSGLMLSPTVAVAQTGGISGTVTSGATPMQNVVVNVYNSAGQVVTTGVSSGVGTYSVSALAPGTYYAYATAPATHVDVLYPGQQCIGGATFGIGDLYCRVTPASQIVVTAGVTATGIDFDLQPGATIAGTISANGSPISAIAELHVSNGVNTRIVRTVSTNAAGAYQIGKLPAGSYFVWTGNVTGAPQNAGGYVTEFNGIACPKQTGTAVAASGGLCSVAAVSPIAVAAAATTAAHFDLEPGGAIAGTVRLGGQRPAKSGVSVSVYSASGAFLFNTFGSPPHGDFVQSGLPPGEYRLTAGSAGFGSEVFDDIACPANNCAPVLTTGNAVTVSVGAIASANFDLALGVPSILLQPQNRSVLSGQSVELRVDAVGAPPLAYQWYLGLSGDVSNPVAGANSSDFTTPPLAAAANYWVSVSSGSSTVASASAQLSLASAGTGAIAGNVSSSGLPLAGIEVAIYGSNELLAATAAATSASGAFSVAGLAPGTYYAFAYTGNVTGSPTHVSALYPNTLCPGSAPNSSGTFCRANTGTVITVSAGAVTSGINFDLPVGGTISGNVTTAGFLPLSPSVQLFVDTGGGTLTPVSAATSPLGRYTIPRLPAGTYRVAAYASSANAEVWDDVVCAGACQFSGGTPISVALGTEVSGRDFDLLPTQPAIRTQPANQSIPVGQTATLAVIASGPAPLTYQWYRGSSGDTTQPEPGATGSSFTTPALSANSTFWVRVTNAGRYANSATVTVTVGTPPSITTQPLGLVLVSGQSATLNVVAAGSGLLNYQWFNGASGTITAPLSGATASTFATPALTADASYWVRVSSDFGSVNSATAVVSIGVPPTITTSPQNATINEGQSTTLTVTAAGTGPLAYTWYEGQPPTTSVQVATGSSFSTPNSLTGTRSYYARVSSPYGVANSNAAVVTALPTVGAPRDVFVKTIVGNQVTLAWRAGQGQLATTGYVLEGGLPGQAAPLAVIPTGTLLTHFTISVPNGSFWIQMRAQAGSALSVPSPQMPLCLNANCPPLAPTNVLGLADGSALSLAWRNPLESGIPTRVTLRVSGTVNAALELPGSAESFSFPSVPSGTFNFQLVACTTAGCSSPSPSTPLTLGFPGACSGPPAPPARFTAEKAGGVLMLDWGLPASGSPPSAYLLNVTGAFNGNVPFSGRGFTGAVPAGTYTFAVSAVNACGTSVATSPLTISVP